MKASTYNKIILATFGAIFIIVGGSNLLFDPYQILHKQIWGKTYYFNNGRTSNAGIINSGTYDGAILGSSMTENFKPSEMEKLMDINNVAKLSTSGAAPVEINAIAKRLFSKNNIKNVILSTHDIFYTNQFKASGDLSPVFPFTLYDDSSINDLPHFFSLMMFADTTRIYRKPHTICKDRDSRLSWTDRHPFGYENFKEKFVINRRKTNYNRYQAKWMTARFDFYIKSILRDNPKTKFHLFFPPCSTLLYSVIAQESPRAFEEILKFRRHVIETCNSIDNADTFFFGNEADIVDNLDNYKDLAHYHGKINSTILKAISKGKNKISVDNMSEELLSFKNRCLKYKLPKEVTLH